MYDPPTTPSSTVTLNQLLVALRARQAPLPFEIGAFLTLEICEAALGRACAPTADEVLVGADGTLALTSRDFADEDACARAVLRVLAQVLAASEPGLPPALLALVEQVACPDRLSLMRVHDDLEAVLVPLNRGAVRRVVARLLRETQRRGERRARVERRLDRLAVDGLPEPSGEALDAAFDALFASLEPVATALPHGGAPLPAVDANADAESRSPSGVSGLLQVEQHDVADPVASRARRMRLLLAASGLVALLLVFGLIVYYPKLGLVPGRDILLRWTQPSTSSSGTAMRVEPVPEVGEDVTGPDGASGGALWVRSWPNRAQVLRLVGGGAATSLRVPVGETQELVIVTSDSVRRMLIPGDVNWQPCDEGLCHSVAESSVQETTTARAPGLGASLLPTEPEHGDGRMGTLHIATSSSQSRVYQLVGFTPHARIQGLDTGETVTLVLYLSGFETAEVALQPGDWTRRDGALVAELDIRLTRRS